MFSCLTTSVLSGPFKNSVTDRYYDDRHAFSLHLYITPVFITFSKTVIVLCLGSGTCDTEFASLNHIQGDKFFSHLK